MDSGPAVAVLCALVLALAGCSGSSDAPTDSTTTTDTSTPAPFVAANCMRGMDHEGCTAAQAEELLAPPTTPIDLAWDGNLGAGFIACPPGEECHERYGVEAHMDEMFTPIKGHLRSLEITLTWDAPTPATEKLRFGIMIMNQTPGENVTMLDTEEGTSPLKITLNDLNYSVADHNWLHLFVRNPTTTQGSNGAVVHVAVDQEFSVEGTGQIHVPKSTT